MEKWKIIIIVLLLGGLAGYGYFEANPGGLPSNPPGVQPTPTPDPKDLALIGTPASGWNIPAEYWVNTPKPIFLKDLKGKVVLLEFWRSGCSHCEAAAPHMIELYKKFKPQGLQVVTFQSPGLIKEKENPENHWDMVQQKVREWNLPYPVAFDKNGKLFTSKYNGHLWPTMVLIDRQGKILKIQHSTDTKERAQVLEQAIMSVLAGKPVQ
jgi:thiol-disulfide isomerase/thioredoxin